MYKNLTVLGSGAKRKIEEPVSAFQGNKKIRETTAMVLKEWQFGSEQQRKARPEFNNLSLLGRIDASQKAFNSYVPPKSDDPDESWRAQTVRPVTRNKLISIAAHVTANMLYPNVFAQNEMQDEDKDAANVMRDLIEWVINNSDYEKTFIQAVITALVDPAVIVSEEYYMVMRKVKEMKEDGTWKADKEVVDQVLSGFCQSVVPTKELLIANFFEPNIQKQRFLIREKNIDHKEAEQIYGSHKNFKYVSPGVRTVFDEESQTFYDVKDDELKGYLDNEVVYYNRTKDLKLTFLNGILVCDPEYPNPRQDKLYPFVKSGGEPIGNGQFFYYKSAADKLAQDQELVDTLYNMVLDGTFMSLMPPMAVYGSEEVDSSIMVPGMMTSFRDPNVKMENIGPRSDLRAGLESISMVEKSLSESSQDNLRSGNQSGGGERTAREVLLMEQNARVALGLFGKQVKFLVEDLGTLIIGDILQHLTVAAVDAISGELAYRSFLLPEKIEGGKEVTKKIQIQNPTKVKGYSNPMEASYDVLEEEGGMDSDKRISKANPELLRKIKYLVIQEADEVTPKSKSLEKALSLELYDRAVQNPLADQEAIYRDFLIGVYKPGQSDKYVAKVRPAPQDPAAFSKNKGTNTSMLSQITGSNNLGIAATTDAIETI